MRACAVNRLSNLRPHVEKFKRTFLAGLRKSRAARKRRETEENAAMTGDW